MLTQDLSDHTFDINAPSLGNQIYYGFLLKFPRGWHIHKDIHRQVAGPLGILRGVSCQL